MTQRCAAVERFGPLAPASLLAIIVGLVVLPSVAQARTAVIDFDTLVGGEEVVRQYAGDGVFFDVDPSGAAAEPPVATRVPDGTAHSSTGVGRLEGCARDFCNAWSYARFANGQGSVDFFAGTFEPLPIFVTFSAFALDGSFRDSVSLTLQPGSFKTPVHLESPIDDIAFIKLQDRDDRRSLGIDDLTVTVPDFPAPADFELKRPDPSPVVLARGTSRSTALTLLRVNGTGPISFRADGLPAGVSATFAPNPATAGGVTTVKATFTASSSAPQAPLGDVTVVATPSPTAGVGPRSVRVPLLVRSSYDLRLRAIEPTQGVQPVDGLAAPTAGATTAGYAGLDLAGGGRTVVRVFADAVGAPTGGVANVNAYLYGRRDGKLLPGSPLLPLTGARTLRDGVNVLDERERDAGGYTFILPPDWTHGSLTLTATVTPPATDGLSFTDPALGECTSCAGNNSLALTGVPFVEVPELTLAPLELTETGQKPLGVAKVFAGAKAVTPLGEGGLVLPPYQATIGLSDKFAKVPGITAKQKTAIALNEVDLYAATKSFGADVVVGVQPGDIGAATLRGVIPLPFGPGISPGVAEVQGDDVRPLSSVAHELGHTLQRVHAGLKCGGNDNGQVGEAWSPDDQGQLQGVGLDRTAGSGSSPAGPFRVIADPAADPPGFVPNAEATPKRFFDLMSYCAGAAVKDLAGHKDFNSWTSPQNWRRELDFLESLGLLAGRAAGARPRLRPVLRVGGVVADGRTVMASLDQLDGEAVSPPRVSPYHLRLERTDGSLLRDVPLTVVRSHGDDGVGVFTLLRAQIPLPEPASLAAVQIVAGGRMLVERRHTAHPPRVRLLAPRSGVLRGRGTLVRWRATDKDGDPLTVRIEYSPDGGRAWRTVLVGGSSGRARIAARLLPASRRARLRVSVSDGFETTHATSGRLRSSGAPPAVGISAPAPRALLRTDAGTYLAGSAFDDRGRPLSGRRLSWYAGRRLLGHGEALTTLGLRAGDRRLSLVAHDGRGRHSVAKIPIRVRAFAPRLLRLDFPHRLAARARRLRLRIACTSSGTLRIGRQRFRVGRRTRTVPLRVRPGRAPLRLRLRLTTGAAARSYRLSVRRSRRLRITVDSPFSWR